MLRRLLVAVTGVAALCASLCVLADAAGASRHSVVGPSISVSPTAHLINGQSVTIKGKNFGKTKHGSIQTWFASECVLTAIAVPNLDPGYSKFCSLPLLQPLRVSPSGSFSAKFKVATGKVGIGDCGVPGHQSCLIAVGTSEGRHTKVALVTFKKITS